jgi:hypothetical protein
MFLATFKTYPKKSGDLDVFFFNFLRIWAIVFPMKIPLYRSKSGENLPVKETLEEGP